MARLILFLSLEKTVLPVPTWLGRIFLVTLSVELASNVRSNVTETSLTAAFTFAPFAGVALTTTGLPVVGVLVVPLPVLLVAFVAVLVVVPVVLPVVLVLFVVFVLLSVFAVFVVVVLLVVVFVTAAFCAVFVFRD